MKRLKLPTPQGVEDVQATLRKLEADVRALRAAQPGVFAYYDELQRKIAEIRKDRPRQNWPIKSAAVAELKKKPGAFVEGFELARRLDAAGVQTFATRNSQSTATERPAHANVERIQRSLGKLIYSEASGIRGVRYEDDPGQVLHIGLRDWKIPKGAIEAEPRKDWKDAKAKSKRRREQG